MSGNCVQVSTSCITTTHLTITLTQCLDGHSDEIFSCAFNYTGDIIVTGVCNTLLIQPLFISHYWSLQAARITHADYDLEHYLTFFISYYYEVMLAQTHYQAWLSKLEPRLPTCLWRQCVHSSRVAIRYYSSQTQRSTEENSNWEQESSLWARGGPN